MKKYLVEKGITLHSETLELTDKQSGPRMPFLKRISDGIYVPTQAVQFKSGEILGIDPVDKSLLMSVSEIIQSDPEEEVPAIKLEPESDPEEEVPIIQPEPDEEKKRPGRPPKAK